MVADLVVRAQHGDHEAFARITEASYGRLLGIAY
jgi:hypothetical protein